MTSKGREPCAPDYARGSSHATTSRVGAFSASAGSESAATVCIAIDRSAERARRTARDRRCATALRRAHPGADSVRSREPGRPPCRCWTRAVWRRPHVRARSQLAQFRRRRSRCSGARDRPTSADRAGSFSPSAGIHPLVNATIKVARRPSGEREGPDRWRRGRSPHRPSFLACDLPGAGVRLPAGTDGALAGPVMPRVIRSEVAFRAAHDSRLPE